MKLLLTLLLSLLLSLSYHALWWMQFPLMFDASNNLNGTRHIIGVITQPILFLMVYIGNIPSIPMLAISISSFFGVFFAILFPFRNKIPKLIFILLFVLFSALPLGTYFSIQSISKITATNENEINTVGIISYRGYPIWYSEGAPGYSFSKTHGIRFIYNTGLWICISVGALSLLAGAGFLSQSIIRRVAQAEQDAAANP